MKPHKGYHAAVTFDDEALLFHGEVVGIRDVLTFQADNAADLTQAFHDSVDDYLDWCAKDGVDPERPFSGALSLRTSAHLHRAMTEAAARQSKSLNQWMVEALTVKASEDLGTAQRVG